MRNILVVGGAGDTGAKLYQKRVQVRGESMQTKKWGLDTKGGWL